MSSRLTTAERLEGVAAVTAIIASFLTWYGYSDGALTVTVNGFRASLLGDVYFIAACAMLVLIAARARVISIGRIDPRAWSVCAGAAAAAAGVQIVLVVVSGHSMHKGLLLAGAAAVAMLWTARQHDTERSRSIDAIN